MRIQSWLAGSLAFALAMGVAGAGAVETVKHNVDSDSSEIVTLTQVKSYTDGSSYDLGAGATPASDGESLLTLAGVSRPDVTMQSALLGPSLNLASPLGSGSLEILPGALKPQNTPTAGACSSAGFPGGWCDTAHNIAANVFGWNFSAGGKGVIIGMVDTGIDLNSPEFLDSMGNSRVLPGYCVVSSVNACTGDNAVGGDDTVFPGGDSTHGTHTTGIAAGLNVGIAYQASILPVKVCGSNVDSCIGVDQGIVWASQHGASVISVSIGGPVLAQSDIANFQTAVANGSLLVVAAGNSGTKDPVSGFLGGAALADGVRGSMIVVGATGCNGPDPYSPGSCANGGYGGIASFSQVPGTQCTVEGTQRYCMANYFVVAPGVDIWSSVGNGSSPAGNYGYLSGTSMATPFVAGVAAVIKGQWPQLTSQQVASIIFQTTDDLGAPGVDPVYGRGAVDITKAMGPVGQSIVATGGYLPGVSGGSGSGGSGVTHSLSTLNGTATPASVTGLGGAQASLVSGPLSVAIRNSTVLQNAVVVDSFGRNFSANLNNATYNPGIDIVSAMLASQFMSVTPFAVSGTGPYGHFAASGYEVETTLPAGLSGQYVDTHQHTMEDVIVDQQLMPGVDLNIGYNLDLSGHFSEYDSRSSSAFGGLFLSAGAVNSPYASLTNGGSYLGSTIQLADDVHMRFGQSVLDPQRGQYQVPEFSYLAQLEGPQPLYDMRQAQSSLFGVDWDFASWGGLGVIATQTSEQNGLLGGFNSGALSVAKSANTSAIGVSARVGFGDGWVTTFSYNEGLTQLSLKPDALISSADTLHSRAYGFAVAKHGLFDEDDSLGLAVTRPLQIYAGGVNITAADGVDSTTGDLKIGHEYVPLASNTPETDLEVGYVTTFMDGALALQANAGYQMNVAGLGGSNAVSVISRAKINF
ncbi:MAG TPA: S8 family serine peptidase [Rhizomicrobium sp.]|nr:S8 family serine peptidase [Rhizomicrobium sp.]